MLLTAASGVSSLLTVPAGSGTAENPGPNDFYRALGLNETQIEIKQSDIFKETMRAGGAGGQGWAIVKRLRAAGYWVAACDRRTGELVATADELGDDGVIAIPLDVTCAEQWDAAVTTVVCATVWSQ